MTQATRRRYAFLAAALAMAVAAPLVAASEGFLSPAPGQSLAPGSLVEVRWTSHCGSGGKEVDEAEIVLSLDGGRTFPVRVTPDMNACAARFLWKVPALPSGQARLALRAGSEERDDAETIEVVSGDFRILPDPDGRVAELKRRAAEWFIPSQPEVLSPAELLEEALSGHGEAIQPLSSELDVALPMSFPGAVRPANAAGEPVPAPREAPAPSVVSCARPAGAPTPLRL